jgi:hypothetical protein
LSELCSTSTKDKGEGRIRAQPTADKEHQKPAGAPGDSESRSALSATCAARLPHPSFCNYCLVSDAATTVTCHLPDSSLSRGTQKLRTAPPIQPVPSATTMMQVRRGIPMCLERVKPHRIDFRDPSRYSVQRGAASTAPLLGRQLLICRKALSLQSVCRPVQRPPTPIDSRQRAGDKASSLSAPLSWVEGLVWAACTKCLSSGPETTSGRKSVTSGPMGWFGAELEVRGRPGRHPRGSVAAARRG